MIDSKKFINNCKETLRILENYNIPDTTRVEKAESFFKEAIIIQYKQIEILDQTRQSVFDILCDDIIRQCNDFINSPVKNILDAKNLLYIILSIEDYINDVQNLPWKIGRKVSLLEKLNIKRISRKVLRECVDEMSGRPVRGTHVKIILTGSLARGHSDWKLINGGKNTQADRL